MIERQTIEGREASVIYLNAMLEPTDKDSAEVVRVVFDDGESLWLTVPPSEESDTDGEAETDEADEFPDIEDIDDEDGEATEP